MEGSPPNKSDVSGDTDPMPTKPPGRRRYVVVTRALSGARIKDGEQLQISTTTPIGLALITYRTRFSDEGFDSPIPRELWVEAVGESDCSLEEAINAYWSAANALLPALSVAANAPIDDLDVHLAFDATPGTTEHEFFENFQPDESGRPRHGRSLRLSETTTVLDALAASNENARLLRACEFYRQALRYLRPGQEVLFVVFAWMAVEALTKVALRQACAAEGVTEDELVVRWGLTSQSASEEDLKKAKRGLDGETRRRLIFHGDADCQKLALQASDAFEHGYEDFAKIRAFAAQAKEKGVAQHVRRAIFELLELPESVIDTLVTGPYEKPRANWLITKYVRGTFVGEAENLAAPEQQYPLLRWEARVSKFRRTEGGTYEVSFDETITVVAGEGVEFRPQTFEVWGPENDPLE